MFCSTSDAKASPLSSRATSPSRSDSRRGSLDLERLAPAELSIVCFRYAPERLRGDDTRLNALNKVLMETIQAEGAAFLTNTTLRGRFALRACVLHYDTTDDDVAALLDAVRALGARE